MAPLDSAMTSSYRLSIVNLSLSAAVRSQFWMQWSELLLQPVIHVRRITVSCPSVRC